MTDHRNLCRFAFLVLAVAAAPGVNAQIEVALPKTTSTAPLLMRQPRVGPPPTGLTVTGTPASATVTWQPAPNAMSYSVSRWLEKDPACCTLNASDLTQTSTSWTDLGANGTGGLQWAGNYVYKVSVTYSDLSVGSAEVTWTRPDPVNPPVINGSSSGAAGLRLFWDPVANASYYMVWGDGMPNTGAQVPGTAPTTELRSIRRSVAPGLYVSGIAPGMGSWTVGSFYSPGPVSTPAAQFTKYSHWVTGAAGLVPPRMPAPTFQATGFNVPEGATNDWQGQVLRTNIPQEQVQGTCPTDVMFFIDGASEPIRAANYYTDDPNPSFRFTNVNGSLYFRAPKIANIPPPTGNNAYVYAINCKGEYTNAVPYKMYPSEFQITSIAPVASFYPNGSQYFSGGDKGTLSGFGMMGPTFSGVPGYTNPDTQKVIFTFRFAKTNGAGTGLDIVEADQEAIVTSTDNRSVLLNAPAPSSLGYGKPQWLLLDAKVRVVKNGITSNSIPVKYCSQSNLPVQGAPSC